MPMDTAKSYDALARHYHLIFENWEASVERQAAVLSSILELKCRLPGTARVLDCACGIGTQALGLARLGFRVHGYDVRGLSSTSRQSDCADYAVPTWPVWQLLEDQMAIDVRGLAPLLSVFDMPTSIKFYCEGLGFEIVATDNLPAPHRSG